MIKKIGISVLILIITFIVCLNIWHADAYILKNNIQHYTALNIHQNTGLKRWVLVASQKASSLLPSYPVISKDRISDVFENQYNVPHSKVGEQKLVSNVAELKEAVKSAIPGNVIILADGDYQLEGKALNLGKPDYLLESDLPIIITSRNFKKSKIKIKSTVGFQVTHKNWIISDLVFEGACDSDNRCEHAIHVVGDADNLKILGNDFVNFNAAIKSNGHVRLATNERNFPDFVLIQYNRFYNEWVRETKSAVTPIDVVGGESWVVSNNFIADFSRKHGRKSSYTYGAFLKGDSKHGIFKSNFVACTWHVPYYSGLDLRIGLSFGGGGTGKQFCASGVCEQEHKKGEMTDNVIANCSQSASIYINKGNDINIENNVLIGSSGIELSKSVNVSVTENTLNGKLRIRNGSESVLETSNQYLRNEASYARY